MAQVENNNSTSRIIATLHPDIIYSHILTRLDGPTLASAAASSPEIRHLCNENHLWQNICSDMWPSLKNPLVTTLISTFPAGHLSIFSDSFPSPSVHHHHSLSCPPPLKLISAVDIYYKGKPFFSRVHSIETQEGWFLRSPLWVDIIDRDETVPIPLMLERNIDNYYPELLNHLQEYLSLSWIVIDSSGKRAANLSSHIAVSARQQCLIGDMDVVYAVAVEEEVQCSIKVTCCREAGGEIRFREVSMTMEDMDGRHVTGRESMVILQRAMHSVKRKRMEGLEAKQSYDKFCCIKRERIKGLMRTHKGLHMVADATKRVVIFTFLFCILKLWV